MSNTGIVAKHHCAHCSLTLVYAKLFMCAPHCWYDKWNTFWSLLFFYCCLCPYFGDSSSLFVLYYIKSESKRKSHFISPRYLKTDIINWLLCIWSTLLGYACQFIVGPYPLLWWRSGSIVLIALQRWRSQSIPLLIKSPNTPISAHFRSCNRITIDIWLKFINFWS